MKNLTSFALTAIIAFFLASCKKDSVNIKASILGKWNIITDSTFSGIGQNNHPVNYTGKPGDYFDLRTDGNIYMKEDTRFDTLSYQLTSDTTIVITSFGLILNGIPEESHITNLTAYTVTISNPILLTPGGIFGRKVNLNR